MCFRNGFKLYVHEEGGTTAHHVCGYVVMPQLLFHMCARDIRVSQDLVALVVVPALESGIYLYLYSYRYSASKSTARKEAAATLGG